jgi:hypothetical protein
MTNPMKDRDAALQCKLRSYEDFLSATLLLKEALENEAFTEVNRLIKRREALIGAMDDLDQRVKLSAPAVSTHRSDWADGQRTAMLEVMKGTLRRILAANRECEALAAGKCESLKGTLKATHHAREGVQGYAPKMGRTDQFLNMKL